MLDRIWVQIAHKMASFWPQKFFKVRKMRPPAIVLKVACLTSSKIVYYAAVDPWNSNWWFLESFSTYKVSPSRRLLSLGWNMTVKYRKLCEFA